MSLTSFACTHLPSSGMGAGPCFGPLATIHFFGIIHKWYSFRFQFYLADFAQKRAAAKKRRPHPAKSHFTDFLHYSFFSCVSQGAKHTFREKSAQYTQKGAPQRPFCILFRFEITSKAGRDMCRFASSRQAPPSRRAYRPYTSRRTTCPPILKPSHPPCRRESGR